jgi:hypothetical protein
MAGEIQTVDGQSRRTLVQCADNPDIGPGHGRRETADPAEKFQRG